MKIYNADLTEELNLEDLDLKRGFLENRRKEIEIEEVPYIEEVGHYEVIKEYENGGKDVKWVVDTPGQKYCAAHTGTEEIQIYFPYSKDQLIEMGLYEYTEEELEEKENTDAVFLRQQKIEEYKQYLADTDYQAIKYFEGWLTEEEYEPIKILRQNARDMVNKYQEELDALLRGEEVPEEEEVLLEDGTLIEYTE